MPAAKPKVEPSENEAVSHKFPGWNPWNLELLGEAWKEWGWGTMWLLREFWHRF
jgi:hypothetical protein